MMTLDLAKKYDVPAPRYTSYPTVPYWETTPSSTQWLDSLKSALEKPSAQWSLYLHLPFCETLCTFCGCNTVITKNHKNESDYIKLIHKEFEIYEQNISALGRSLLEEVHLGGGTPTFFSSENLYALLSPIFKRTKFSPDADKSIEVDPRRTNIEHLKVLKELGFNRISLGVQDFNPEVQRLVNRSQPFEVTAKLTCQARELGYTSINYDLIYGLPKQTLSTMTDTVNKTVSLRPDRIALYSYAHVPWIKPAQRLFTEADLPQGDEKRHLYENARGILLASDYVEIGMDHFALKTDSLYISNQNKTLHRNFMGYTSRRSEVLLGLGVSAISETPTCFHQNEKVLNVYGQRLGKNELPTHRGHILTAEDSAAREQILKLMTVFETELEEGQLSDVKTTLAPLLDDALVEIDGRKLSITDLGRPYLRNVCMALDRRLRAKAPQTKIFSQAL